MNLRALREHLPVLLIAVLVMALLFVGAKYKSALTALQEVTKSAEAKASSEPETQCFQLSSPLPQLHIVTISTNAVYGPGTRISTALPSDAGSMRRWMITNGLGDGQIEVDRLVSAERGLYEFSVEINPPLRDDKRGWTISERNYTLLPVLIKSTDRAMPEAGVITLPPRPVKDPNQVPVVTLDRNPCEGVAAVIDRADGSTGKAVLTIVSFATQPKVPSVLRPGTS